MTLDWSDAAAIAIAGFLWRAAGTGDSLISEPFPEFTTLGFELGSLVGLGQSASRSLTYAVSDARVVMPTT